MPQPRHPEPSMPTPRRRPSRRTAPGDRRRSDRPMPWRRRPRRPRRRGWHGRRGWRFSPVDPLRSGLAVALFPADDLVAEDAQALDLGLDHVTGLEVEVEGVLLDRRDAADGAGRDEVARTEDLRRVVRDEV